MITHEGLAVFFALFLLVLFFFAVIVPIIKRNKPRKITQQPTEQNAPVENPFNAPPAETHTTIIIDRCEGCRSKFDPPRVAAGEYVADDLMQHFCTTECYDRIIDLCLPFYYHKGRNAAQDPTFQDYMLKRYSDDYPGLKQAVYKEVYKWNKRKKEETDKVTNRLRERVRERYQRKDGLEVEPQPALDGSTITFAGSERINAPRDGGCRRGYCYACGQKIGSLLTSKNDPTLPRGDTSWFCSSFCYTRTLRAWVPFGYRYEPDDPDDETWAHKKDRERYFREAVPKLHAYLENIEREEEEYQPILRLEEELKRLQAEEEKRASYKHFDPPEHWTPLPDDPVIRTIKKPTSDRCLKCGALEKSARPVFVPDTPFWYCSDTCSFEATQDFMPKRWVDGPVRDPDFTRFWEAHYERGNAPADGLYSEWEPHYQRVRRDARDNLEDRLRAEARKQEAEEAEKEAEMQDRQWEKDYIAAEKEHEQFLEQEAYEQALIFKPIPDHLRIHTGIIAKTGWGKTQLLQTLILWELKKPNPPSLIVLDSTGKMVELIQNLALFNDRLRDRILIIDPAHSPSLNMFDLSSPRFETYTREQKEDLQNEIVNLFNYVFSSEDYKLTGQMGIGFAYAVRLILSRPNSTIRDLRRLLEEDCKRCEQSAFAADIAQLDEDAQDFFRSHFYSDELKKTRAAIARRLQLIVSVPAFARMFITSRNALDLYAETQDKRSIILVNTNEQLLKEGSYILFGRYIVARTMAAILERASIPRDQRTVTHLIIDEGSPYMDETFDTLLTRVRQYGLKVTIAFQHFQQLTDKLKNSVAGQTSVKYAGGLSYQDARFLSNKMRCEPDFLTSLKTDISDPPKLTQFAAYADNWNDNHSMLLTLPFFTMEREPKMTPDQYAAMLARNRQRIAPAAQVTQKPQTTAPKQDTENPSVPEQHKPPREPSTPTQAPAKSAPTDPHVGVHTEPASKWGE